MSELKKIYMTDQTLRFISVRTKCQDESPSWSAAVNSGFTALEFFYRDNMPELTFNEWLMILNAYCGTAMDHLHLPVNMASDIMDDLGADSLDQLDETYQLIIKHIASLTQGQQLAALDLVQRFWSITGQVEDENTESLIQRLTGQ